MAFILFYNIELLFNFNKKLKYIFLLTKKKINIFINIKYMFTNSYV